ncbi:hypothetical protein KJ966_18155 [bacterium]|nr:hypothetical protein [bacterium]
MKPTQNEIEEEIEKLASVLNLYKDKGQQLMIQLKPYLDVLNHSLDQMVVQSPPKLKRLKLHLEILYLKSQLKMINALIKAKQVNDSEVNTKWGDDDQADDPMPPAE